RSLLLAVATPVRPKEQNHGFAFERSERRRLGSQELALVKIRSRLAFQRDKVDVLLNSCVNRGAAIDRQFFAEQRDRLVSLAALVQHLCLHLDGGAERQGQVRFRVERALLELFQYESLCLPGVRLRLIELLG